MFIPHIPMLYASAPVRSPGSFIPTQSTWECLLPGPSSWSPDIKPPLLFSAHFILMHSDMKQASAIFKILAVPVSPNWQPYGLDPLNFGCPGRPPFWNAPLPSAKVNFSTLQRDQFLVTLAQIQPLTCFHHSWLLRGIDRQTDRSLRLGIEVESFLCPAVTFWRDCLS